MKRHPIRILFLLTLGLFSALWSLNSAYAGTFQIAPKGNKKIKVAVMDLISSVAVAPYVNNWYKKHAAERKWELKIFDLHGDFANARPTMENIITAGYDAILVNWTDFKYYDDLIMKAYKMGIPVQGVACGNMKPGVVSHGAGTDIPTGGASAQYLCSRLKEGQKILAYHDPRLASSLDRFHAAKLAFDTYLIKVQELQFPGSGDPYQVCYENVKNALLADDRKEIKGIWTPYESFGISAARAANDMGRTDVIVVTGDDSPSTYSEFRNLPTLQATVGTLGFAPIWTAQLFKNLDKIFAGKPFADGEVWFMLPYLVTRENLPPKGYFFSYCGYRGKPDFEVK